jgi:hypothetical protein
LSVYGRLASLLEVGTGFHPEFSGRDNIYLNGTMLESSRKEVRKRFDQIVRQEKAGKIWLGLELPFLPIKPGEYILSCTISDGIHPLAFLRATPELTVLEEKNAQSTGYHGVLNLPTRLSVQG